MFFGRYEPEPGGVRIEGQFHVLPFTKWFMRGWLGFAVLISALVYFKMFEDLFSGSRSFSDLSGLELIPLGFVLYGIFFPRFGQRISSASERFILDYLQDNLAARPAEDMPDADAERAPTWAPLTC